MTRSTGLGYDVTAIGEYVSYSADLGVEKWGFTPRPFSGYRTPYQTPRRVDEIRE
jgi:hypothetical protein